MNLFGRALFYRFNKRYKVLVLCYVRHCLVRRVAAVNVTFLLTVLLRLAYVEWKTRKR